MFDAKSILEALVRGAAPQPQAAPQPGGGLGDILGQLTKMAGGAGGAASQAGGVGGIEDMLRKMMPQQGSAPSQSAQAAPSEGGMGGLGDILAKLQQQAAGAAGGDQCFAALNIQDKHSPRCGDDRFG